MKLDRNGTERMEMKSADGCTFCRHASLWYTSLNFIQTVLRTRSQPFRTEQTTKGATI